MSAERDVTHVLITPDDLQEHVRQAYLAGCRDVQENYRPLREGEDPVFGEASYDYVASIDFTETTRPGALPDLIAAAREVDRWMLVIESAMRADAPRDHRAVLDALITNRDALAKALGTRAPAGDRS